MAEVWNKYADTAARKHGKPGREVRPKSLTVDMHCHVAVPRVAEIVAPHLKQVHRSAGCRTRRPRPRP